MISKTKKVKPSKRLVQKLQSATTKGKKLIGISISVKLSFPWMQLMVDFVSNCFVTDLDYDVKRKAIQLRKKQKLKLPDAIIAASSMTRRLPLFTADKGFDKIAELNVILY